MDVAYPMVLKRWDLCSSQRTKRIVKQDYWWMSA